MRKEIFDKSILGYLDTLNNTNWIVNESYKFEFANFLQSNINFNNQSNEEILELLIYSQKIDYGGVRGIQFIQKSGKETLSSFINYNDVTLFREFYSAEFDSVKWRDASMSFTGLSAWLSSLFPSKIYPVPAKGFSETINYLFKTNYDTFPKVGQKYIIECQKYLAETNNELRKYPIEEM